jgi:CBS domain-containing protein
MATVADILRGKPNRVHSISPRASVLDATHQMNRHRVGSLLVMEADQVVGILSERDVLTRIVAEEKNPRTVTVGQVMTTEVIVCRPDTPVEDVSAIMKNRRVRHLPVCDEDGRLVGLISIGDLNAHHASHQEITIHYLNEYLYGRV